MNESIEEYRARILSRHDTWQGIIYKAVPNLISRLLVFVENSELNVITFYVSSDEDEDFLSLCERVIPLTVSYKVEPLTEKLPHGVIKVITEDKVREWRAGNISSIT